jgi:hypothetical protein
MPADDEGVITLLEAPSCTRMNLERAGLDMLLPLWESRSMR